MSDTVTLDAARYLVNWARRTVGAHVVFPSMFMLVTDLVGDVRTRSLFVRDRSGNIRGIPHDEHPAMGLDADVRGALFDGAKGSGLLLLVGSCIKPYSRIYADPKDPAAWDVEASNLTNLKAFMHARDPSNAWNRCQPLFT